MNIYYKYPRLVLLILTLSAFVLTSFILVKKKPDHPTAKQQKVTIVMFGDSIIKGANWNELLGRDDVKNSGFPGFTTSHFVWLIKEHVVDLKPEICFLEGGINDIGVGIPLSRTKENYEKNIDILLKNNIVPVLQSVLYQQNNPQSKVQVDSLNNYLKAYAKIMQIQYLDINTKLSSDTGLKAQYTVDGTHINQSAYQIWAAEVKVFLATIKSKKAN